MFKKIAAICLALCGVLSFSALTAAETPTVLYTENYANIAKWRNNAAGVLTAELDKTFSANDTCYKLTFKIDDPNKGNAWPQQIRWFRAVDLSGNDVYFEFDVYYQPVKGKMNLRVSLKDLAGIVEPSFRLKPDSWNHVVLPVKPRKAGAKFNGYAFVIAKKAQKAGDEAVFYIKNIRVVKGKKFAAAKPRSATRPGHFSTKVVPAASRPKDTRLEIEIPNLVNNAYFRMGGKDFPPPGWGTYGIGSYGESYHDGRSVHLPGSATSKTVALRQGGLVLIPGEKYRLSGYIRGGGFTGYMNGHIGIACDNWSKIRAYWFTNGDIKPDWQYFEVIFTPDVSKAKEYEAIIYRSGSGGGWIEVDRLIIEGITPNALKNSRNKYADDSFDADYAKALKSGSFRSGPPSKDYELVWSDEFNGDKVDDSKWHIYTMDFGGKRDYRLVPQAMKLDGKGHLLFTTSLAADGKVEQPRISTTKHHTWVYGYFEARLQLHDSNLANAAFWMLPEGKMDPFDPVNKGMEIDIMECVSPALENLSHTTHWYNFVPKLNKRVSFSGGTRSRHAPGLSKGFHTVALEWTPTDLIFYIDGVKSWHLNTKDHPIPKNPHNLIFSFGGRNKEIMKRPGFATTFTIDYVRVWQKKEK